MPLFKSMSAFQRVIAALILGIATGLFFGEIVAPLDILGEAYIRLLQMTVLPYVLVSLVGSLGRLDAVVAKRAGVIGALLILSIWGITLAFLLFLPFVYPNWTTSSFFSTSLIEPPEPFDALTLYVPANPFYSLANGVVPAVVVFSILLGTALMGVASKQELLKNLATLGDALMRMASMVGKLAPLGIFAISAAAAGTLRVEELARLQVFLWGYLALWVMLAYCALPMLVAWATPFSYREVVKAAQVPMITALATGTVLVVLPMIAERCKEMLAEKRLENTETESMVDLLAPTAYSFPSAGTLLGLGFVMFAAWYVGSPLGVVDYPNFVAVGAFVAFGSMSVAIPFMLDFFALPADLFQLYLLGSVITARLATALAAMHGIVVCLLGGLAITGKLKIRPMARAAGASVGMIAALTLALGFVLTRAIPYEYTGEETFSDRALVAEPTELVNVDEPAPLSARQRGRSRLGVIRERGSLRVGYPADALPFAYRNSNGETIGFDADLVHRLGRDLGVRLEIVRMADAGDMAEWLDAGRVDVMVGGVAITPDRAAQMSFSRSYSAQTVAFLVPDHLRDEFSNLEALRSRESLKLAVPNNPYYIELIEDLFPEAELVFVESPRAFLQGIEADAMVYSAEAGSAWTLVYPAYTVTVPQGLNLKAPVALALPQGSPDFVAYLNTWLELTEANGVLDELYRYWILGEALTPPTPRWSVLRNVFGYGE